LGRKSSKENFKMKILIITYEFPPNVAVGAFRPYSWYKYLGDTNDEITVVTRKWSGTVTNASDYSKTDVGDCSLVENGKNRIFYVPYKKATYRDKLIKKKGKIIGKVRQLLTFIQLFTIWNFGLGDEKKFIYKFSKELLKKEKFDLIIATGEPFILFKYAFDLSSKYKIPYILDYRDAWFSGERHKMNKSKIASIIRNFQFRFEKKYIENALCFTSVSDLLTNDIANDFPNSKKIIVKNGVDLEVISNVKEYPDVVNDFIISYTGTIYNGHNVSIFLAAFLKLMKKNPNVKLKFIGISLRPSKHFEQIRMLAGEYPSNIEIIQSLPQNEVFRWMKSSQILLKFSMRTTSMTAQSVKMYEYFAFQKPVLHILSENAEENNLLREKKVQFFAKTESEIEDILLSMYNKWSENGSLKTHVKDDDLKEFSRKEIAKKFRQDISNLMKS
jgi:glycosyltransferase involved in cell wall biosynthesis